MAYIYDIADTWNAIGTTFKGIALNVTDTASAAGSLLMDLQVGGVSEFSVGKSAGIRFGAGEAAGAVGVGIYSLDNTSITFGQNAGSTRWGGITGAGFVVTQAGYYGWGNTTLASPDLFLFRDAANTLAQRNGVNAQAFNLYNTYTDASNYERGFMRFVSNAFEIGTAFAGTGTSRALVFQTNGATRLTIAANGDVITNSIGASSGTNFVLRGASTGAAWRVIPSGNFDAQVDNAYDIGASSANRPRNLFLGSYAQLSEMTAPAAPATNNVRIYAEDDGSGKTRLMALFATGAAVQIAIEP